jgi:CarboxypepD_reg-like domain
VCYFRAKGNLKENYSKLNETMKIQFALAILFIFFQKSHSQTIHDTIFNDIILIERENVTIKENDFIINFPFKVSKQPIIIYNNDRRIPNNFFFNRTTFLYKQNEIILLKNDWEYYKRIRESEKRTGLHLKPLRQARIYHINRISEKVDSSTITFDDPKKPIIFNFRKIEKIVYGVVKDYLGQLIVGANINVKGKNIGTNTDFDGKYSLKTSMNDTLIFSFIEMKTKKVKVETEEINIQLEELDEKLFEVYGPPIVPKKENINLSTLRTISAKELNKSIKKSKKPKYNFKKNAKNNIYMIFVSELRLYEFNNKDLEFQKKYNVKYSLIGTYEIDFLTKYNKLTFNYLKKKYKKTWITEIRKDAVGLKEM